VKADEHERIGALEDQVDDLERRTSKRGATPIWRHCLGCETRFAVFVVNPRADQRIVACPLCGADRLTRVP
jgi:ribosomal protein L37AE/L43A